MDLTQIDGVDVKTAQAVISEVERDMSRWKSEKQFASWLGLCPGNRIIGGKVLKRGTRHWYPRFDGITFSGVGLATLGAKFHRARSRLGAPKAITAMTHLLAPVIYRMFKIGHEYVDKGMEYYEPNTGNSSYNGSPSRPLHSTCNPFLSRELSVRFLDSVAVMPSARASFCAISL